MNLVMAVAVVFPLLTVLLAARTYWWNRQLGRCGADAFMGMTVVVIFMSIIGVGFAGVANKWQFDQFCLKYQITDSVTAHYENKTDLPVMVRVATYGMFSGEREMVVIVPPKRTHYFGVGRILAVDSE